METAVIILAAGKGVRMNSDLPKVCHRICGKPLISWVVEAVNKAGFNENIYIVVGYRHELVKEACADLKVKFVHQADQLGTGHAVTQAGPALKDFNGTTLVLNGDAPLIKPATLKKLMDYHIKNNASASVLTAVLDDPNAYGRIIKGGDGGLLRIVEKKDAGKEELMIREINTGTYCFNNKDLFETLPKLKNKNAQQEYYLTDVIGMLASSGRKVLAFSTDDPTEALGVNTREELALLEEICKNER